MTKNKKKFSLSNHIWNVLGVLLFFSSIMALMLVDKDIALLNPKGVIAEEQFRLLVISSSIMLGFAAIVIFFIYFFAWRYRETDETNTELPDPNAGRSKKMIFLAWASPILIFITLAGFMLPATQKLEPQKPIESSKDEVVIRVVAMRWKWLFLYPEQNIATVNFVQLPVNTPVRFELTADEAPMQAFWIPHLGGMLYAMTEHVNTLNLMGNTVGDYNGGAAEINGHGFAGMRFTASVTSQSQFDNWVEETAKSSPRLGNNEYARLLEPSENNSPASYFSPTNKELFASLVNKYSGSHSHTVSSEHAEGGAH